MQEQPTKQQKAKAKKWRKQSTKGSINTAASMVQCKTFGVPVSPSLQWEGSVTERPVRELQGLLSSVLQAMVPARHGSANGSDSSSGGGGGSRKH